MSRFTACILGFAIVWFAVDIAADCLALFASDRGSDWPMARMGYIRNHPACEACGAVDELSVHHIKPVEDGGTNEPSNLITLCDPNDRGMDRTLGCHWTIGHLGAGWTVANPECRKQAAALLRRTKGTK